MFDEYYTRFDMDFLFYNDLSRAVAKPISNFSFLDRHVLISAEQCLTLPFLYGVFIFSQITMLHLKDIHSNDPHNEK